MMYALQRWRLGPLVIDQSYECIYFHRGKYVIMDPTREARTESCKAKHFESMFSAKNPIASGPAVYQQWCSPIVWLIFSLDAKD
jgi:hypothetical protein